MIFGGSEFWKRMNGFTCEGKPDLNSKSHALQFHKNPAGIHTRLHNRLRYSDVSLGAASLGSYFASVALKCSPFEAATPWFRASYQVRKSECLAVSSFRCFRIWEKARPNKSLLDDYDAAWCLALISWGAKPRSSLAQGCQAPAWPRSCSSSGRRETLLTSWACHFMWRQGSANQIGQHQAAFAWMIMDGYGWYRWWGDLRKSMPTWTVHTVHTWPTLPVTRDSMRFGQRSSRLIRYIMIHWYKMMKHI